MVSRSPHSTPRFDEHADHVGAIVRAAIDAASPRRCVTDRAPSDLRHQPCRVIAVGKASVGMTEGLVLDLHAPIVEGVIVGPPGTCERVASLARATSSLVAFDADHPLPTERNVAAARHVSEIARKCAADGTPLIVLISGGASAQLSLPRDGVSLDDLRDVTQRLLRAGVTIHELNTVRKQLEQLKGGGLARLAAPAPIHALILSDVLGDDPSVIASGPVTPNATTPADSIAVLRQRGLESSCSRVIHFLEQVDAEQRGALTGNPPSPTNITADSFPHVHTTIVGNNAMALDAAAACARSLGFGIESVVHNVQGESREAGTQLGERARLLRSTASHASCILFGGETTVTVRGDGVGGRNQELTLAAAIAIDGCERIAVASFGTDGIDGPTDAAGAIATGLSCDHAKERGIDPQRTLDRNDSHSCFDAIDSLIHTGPTGTNVNDIAFALIYEQNVTG